MSISSNISSSSSDDKKNDSRKKSTIGKVALITGITGQDGSYLAELLLGKGYIVHGTIRRASTFNTKRIDHLYKDRHVKNVRLFLHYSDLSDALNISKLVTEIKPSEVYNLGAQSHVKVSFELPDYTGNVDGLGTLRLLEAIRFAGLEKTCRFYQASTSELFGLVQETPQTEKTPFYPRSPYACAKLYAYWIVVNYREAYGIHASNGILFNHESPRRGETFVTRKISRAVVRIKRGAQKCLYIGNVDAKRDWGHAREYVEMMWKMLQQDKPDDYVCGTGETHSVREFIELAFATVNIHIKWKGSGVDEVAINPDNNQIVVRVDPQYYRPTEVELLLSNPEKARKQLGWSPKITFKQLVKEMVESDDNELSNKSISLKASTTWVAPPSPLKSSGSDDKSQVFSKPP